MVGGGSIATSCDGYGNVICHGGRLSEEGPMKLQAYGVRKYPPTSELLASSAGLGWSTISVELRYHGVIEVPAIVPQCVEICLVVAGNDDGLVRRRGAGFFEEATPKSGAIWLSPAGIGKEIEITASIPETMHLYLPTSLFNRLKDDFSLPVGPAHSIRLAAGIRDDVIDQIGRSILSELTVETAAGRVYVETASLTLAARLLQKYCDSGACGSADSSLLSHDHIRLRRVLDYIESNIGNDITLLDLAAIAGYSPFHFARKFTHAMGISPHRYISRIRLGNAMAELAAGKLPLAEVALNAQFSSQASFTRAFHRATGMTPKEYRYSRL
jgi:AraC family transcriptional regulator